MQKKKRETLKLIIIGSLAITIFLAIIFKAIPKWSIHSSNLNPTEKTTYADLFARVARVGGLSGPNKASLVGMVRDSRKWLGKIIDEFTTRDNAMLSGNMTLPTTIGSDFFVVREGGRVLETGPVTDPFRETLYQNVRRAGNLDIMVPDGQVNQYVQQLRNMFGPDAVTLGTTFRDPNGNISQQVFVKNKALFNNEETERGIVQQLESIVKPENLTDKGFEINIRQAPPGTPTVDLYTEKPHSYGDLTKPGGQLLLMPEELNKLKEIAVRGSLTQGDAAALAEETRVLEKAYQGGLIEDKTPASAFDYFYEKTATMIHPTIEAANRINNMTRRGNGWGEPSQFNSNVQNYFNPKKIEKQNENYETDLKRAAELASSRDRIFEVAEDKIKTDLQEMLDRGDIRSAEEKVEMMKTLLGERDFHPDLKNFFQSLLPDLENQIDDFKKFQEDNTYQGYTPYTPQPPATIYVPAAAPLTLFSTETENSDSDLKNLLGEAGKYLGGLIPGTPGEFAALLPTFFFSGPLGQIAAPLVADYLLSSKEENKDNPRLSSDYFSTVEQYTRNSNEISSLNAQISQAQAEFLRSSDSYSRAIAESKLKELIAKRDELIKENGILDNMIKNPSNYTEEAQKLLRETMEREGLPQTGVGPEIDEAIKRDQTIQAAENAKETLERFNSTGEWGAEWKEKWDEMNWKKKYLPEFLGGTNEAEFLSNRIAEEYEKIREAEKYYPSQEEQKEKLGIPSDNDKEINEAVRQMQMEQEFTRQKDAAEKALAEISKYPLDIPDRTFGGKTEEEWQKLLDEANANLGNIEREREENRKKIEETTNEGSGIPVTDDRVKGDRAAETTPLTTGDRTQGLEEVPGQSINTTDIPPIGPSPQQDFPVEGPISTEEPYNYKDVFMENTNGSPEYPLEFNSGEAQGEEAISKIYEYDEKTGKLKLKENWQEELGLPGGEIYLKQPKPEEIADALFYQDKIDHEKWEKLKKEAKRGELGIQVSEGQDTYDSKTGKPQNGDKDDKEKYRDAKPEELIKTQPKTGEEK